MQWIDSHCHLDDDGFTQDRFEVVARAQAQQVTGFVVPAICQAHWQRLARVTQEIDGGHAAYGLHPLYLDHHQPAHLDALPAWLTQHRACAIGECGLDGFVKSLDWREQQRYFTAQVTLAQSLNLPLIIHARRALDAVLQILRRARVIGVVHSFIGSVQQAKQLIDMGFYLGIGGPVTYPRAQKLRRVVVEVPLNRLLVETDAPDQPLWGRQGQRNEPAMTAQVGYTIAMLRGESPEVVAQVTSQNAVDLFRLPLTH